MDDMDDTQPKIGLLPDAQTESNESESNRADSIVPVSTTVESAPTLPIATNGTPSKRIAANRANAKKSMGPKTSHGKAMSSWNSSRHGLLSNRLPLLYGRSKKQAIDYCAACNRTSNRWARWRRFWLRRLSNNTGVSV